MSQNLFSNKKTRRLSYSQISTFDECPRKWFFSYKLRMRPKVSSPALQFGSAVHKVLEDIVNGIAILGKIRYEEYSSKMTSKLQSEFMVGAPVLIEAAEELLNTLDMSLTQENITAETFYEYPGYVGVIDLVLTDKNGKTWIIDWKTTSRTYTEHQILTSDQLTSYAWLYYRKYKTLPDYVSYITLNIRAGKAKMYRSSRTVDDINEWETKVEQVEKEIEFVTRQVPESCEGNYGRCFFYKNCWGTRKADVPTKLKLKDLALASGSSF